MDDKILEGTTTVGITCKDGVVFASERRASMGNLVAHKVAEKIFKIYHCWFSGRCTKFNESH